jgi:hypothetical protein
LRAVLTDRLCALSPMRTVQSRNEELHVIE